MSYPNIQTQNSLQTPSYSTLDGFKILRKIENGGTSKVKLVEDSLNSTQYAAKILKTVSRSSLPYRTLFEKEVNFLSKLHHTNILRLKDFVTCGTYIKKNRKGRYPCMYILTEFCANKDLYNFIFKYKSFDEDLTRFYFHQIVGALEICNKADVCHGDLKLENLLLDDQFDLKLADFGLSKDISGDKINEFTGTDYYMSPEINERKLYDGFKADIFSAGVTLFVMHIGAPPFYRACMNDRLYYQLQHESEDY